MSINERNKLLVKDLLSDLKNGKINKAICTYRELTGDSLKEAKIVCEKYGKLVK